MTEKTEHSVYEWRYVARGTKTHALYRLNNGRLHATAQCGLSQQSMSKWHGGHTVTRERAATMPKCSRCLERTGGVA